MQMKFKLAVVAAAVALAACGKKEEAAPAASAPVVDTLVVKIA